MSTPPRRRWIQFGMRTMFVVVTAIAVWLGWELNYIRERREFSQRPRVLGFNQLESIHDGMGVDLPTIPFWRRWLGDHAILNIAIRDSPEEDASDAMRLFPEAEIYVHSESGSRRRIGSATAPSKWRLHFPPHRMNSFDR